VGFCLLVFLRLPSVGAFHPHNSTPVNEQPAYGGTQAPLCVKKKLFFLVYFNVVIFTVSVGQSVHLCLSCDKGVRSEEKETALPPLTESPSSLIKCVINEHYNAQFEAWHSMAFNYTCVRECTRTLRCWFLMCLCICRAK